MWDTVAGEYETSGVALFEPAGRALVDLASLRPGDRVLDVATGRGHVLRPAMEAVGAAGLVAGVDIAWEMLRRTREELPRSVGLVLADASDPPFAVGSFDAVLAGFVLFMLQSPEQAVARWRRLVRTGGVLAFTTYGPRDDRMAAVRRILAEARGGSSVEPEPDPLESAVYVRDMLTGAGFADVVVRTERVELEFADLDQWWGWARSVALRASLDLLTEEQVRACDKAVAEVLTGADGAMSLATTVHFAVGRRS